MHNYIKYLGILAAASVVFTACDDKEAAPAKAAIAIDKTDLEVNESMVVHFTGDAENVVIYPGDESHDYELRSSNNSGLVVNKGLFTYSYPTPGRYKVVCVATNHEDAGRSLLSDTCSVWVNVTDDVTEIEKISAPAVLYDEIFATRVNAADWLLPIPRKIHYKTSNPSVNLKKQKLRFYINSTSTTVEIKPEGAPDSDYALFNETVQYNLEQTYDIRTTSHEGTTAAHRLYTLNYGEFKTFKAAGVTGQITRTEYDYTYYEINMEVPAGTNLKTLAPEFTLYGDNEKVYLDGNEAASGTPTDFTSPVTYTFEVTSPTNPAVKVESTCVVTVTTK